MIRGTLTQVNNYLIRYYDSSELFSSLKRRIGICIQRHRVIWMFVVCVCMQWLPLTKKRNLWSSRLSLPSLKVECSHILWNPDLCTFGQKISMFNVSSPKPLKLRSLPTLFSLHSYVGLAMAWNTNECSEAQMTFRNHTYSLINKWMYLHFMSLLFGTS